MKNKILYILLLILIICFISVIGITIKNKSNNNNNNNNNNIGITEISEERLKELFNNSYKYYILKEGLDENSTGKLEINNIEYTKVNIVNSIKEINDLINNTFVEEKRIIYYNELFNNRNYIEIADSVYFENKGSCNNIDINYDNITINNIEDDIIFIDAQNTGVSAYYVNNNWYLSDPLHFCE